MADVITDNVNGALSWRDYMGFLMMRLGVGRYSYKVAPGLYQIGSPDQTSPVFVSANYKMSFDLLRKGLARMSAWILVIDTRGINVWCAAGKRTFSTCEVVRMIRDVGLDKIVNHRELILPQLSAAGVSAHEVKRQGGFKVVFGPVRARDIETFMTQGKNADDSMRTVTFSLRERFVLTPLELTSRILPSICVVAAIFVISLLGYYVSGSEGVWIRAILGMSAYLIGLVAGGRQAQSQNYICSH